MHENIKIAAMIFIAALAVAAPAHAAEIAWMPNEAGGEVILTNDRTADCGARLHLAVARSNDGDVFRGCWTYTETGYVYAVFGEKVRMWKLTDFKLFEYPNQQTAPRGVSL